jgi:hypothetical protein
VGKRRKKRREEKRAEGAAMRALRRRLAKVRSVAPATTSMAKARRLATRHRILKRQLRKEAQRAQEVESLRAWKELEEKKDLSEVEYWRRLKQLAGKGKSHSQVPETMKDDNDVVRAGADAELVWTAGWNSLGVEDFTDSRFDTGFALQVVEQVAKLEEQSRQPDGPGRRTHVTAEALDADVSLVEVKAAIARLRKNKAMGVDEIPNEVFMAGGDEFVKLVRAVLHFVWVSEQVPHDWAVGLISPLFKAGDRQKTSDYRGITLLCTLGKVYGSVLDARLKAFCETELPNTAGEPRLADEQGGFRPTRGCPDQIFALSEVLRKRKAAKLATFCCFIDISKAYDGVFRAGLWKRLFEFGVRGKMWRVLKSMLKDTASSMVINGKRLEEFTIEVGVRQGCVLSPTLFSIFFDGLVMELRRLGIGARFYGLDAQSGGGERLSSLFFADDIVLLAESAKDLSRMLECVEAYSKRWRFALSKTKTEVVVFNGKASDKEDAAEWCCVNGKPLKVCDHYKYLGMEFEENLQAWTKFKTRMVEKAGKVMRAAWGMGLQNGHMSVDGGVRLWTAFARPILEYGAEIWEREKHDKWDAAEQLQKEMGTKILRCSITAAHVFVRGELGWWSLKARRVMLRLRYWGKLIRMDEGRLVKKIYRESKRDHDDDNKVMNWCSYTHELLRTVGLADHWDDLSVVRDAGAWTKMVGEKVADWEQTNWRAEVAGNRVLDVYKRMKHDLGPRESYLAGHGDPTGRMWLTRLRSGRHGLAVNTGRYKTPAPPREERWCEWCAKHGGRYVMENERHAVLACPRYASERLEMLAELSLDGMTNGDDSFEALDRLIGKGLGPQLETKEERAKRHMEVKRFVRRVLRKRIDGDENRW